MPGHREPSLTVPNPLIGLFRSCVVRIDADDEFVGSGFFVAPGEVLTCAHVVHAASRLTVVWEGGSSSATVKRTLPALGTEDPAARFYPLPDVALLELGDPPVGHPCVALELTEPTLGPPPDRLRLDAYTKGEHGPGVIAHSGTTLDYDGPLDEPGGRLLKLKRGQVVAGYSGGPLLNLRTGRVCAVVDSTLSPTADLGGFGVPVASFLDQLAHLAKRNAAYHRAHPSWRQATQAEATKTAERAGAPGDAMDAREAVCDYLRAVIEKAARRPVWMSSAAVRLDGGRRVTVTAAPRGSGLDKGACLSWDEARQWPGPAIAVIGDAGMGKTFLLADEAARLAGEALVQLDTGLPVSDTIIPLWLPLDRVTDQVTPRGFMPGLPGAVVESIMVFNDPRVAKVVAVVDGEPRPQRVWLLDALDEVPVAARDGLIVGLQSLASGVGDDRLILTCRTAAWTNVFQDAVVCLLEPFDAAERDAFLHSWFARDRAVESAVVQSISTRPGLDTLTRVPLFAALACLVHGSTVDTATQLLIEAVGWLMGANEQDKGSAYRQTARRRKAKQDLLAAMAWHLANDECGWRSDDSTDRLEAVLAEACPQQWRYLRDHKDHDRWARTGVLEELAQRDGVLSSDGDLSYEFVHRSFAEYFAARWLSEHPDDWTSAIAAHGWFAPEWQPTFASVAGCLSDLEPWRDHRPEPVPTGDPTPWLSVLLAEIDGPGDPGHQLRAHAARALTETPDPTRIAHADRIAIETALIADEVGLFPELAVLAAKGVRTAETVRVIAALAACQLGVSDPAQALEILARTCSSVVTSLAQDQSEAGWVVRKLSEALRHVAAGSTSESIPRTNSRRNKRLFDQLQAADSRTRRGSNVVAPMTLSTPPPPTVANDGIDDFRRLALDKKTDDAVRVDALTALAALRRQVDADVFVIVAWDDYSSSSVRQAATTALRALGRPEADLLWALSFESHDEIQDADKEDFIRQYTEDCRRLLDSESINRLVALLINDVLIRDTPGGEWMPFSWWTDIAMHLLDGRGSLVTEATWRSDAVYITERWTAIRLKRLGLYNYLPEAAVLVRRAFRAPHTA